MSRVLVTGASGFVGRATLEPLLAAGHEVHAVSRASRSGEGVHWHAADLLEPQAAQRLVADVAPSHLLHLAWDVTPGAFWRSPENLAWVGASLRLLRAFAEGGGRRATLAGTCAEYAWAERTHCVEGQTPLEPATLYGASKHALRVVADAYAAQAGISLSWGRVFFVFGPHEQPGRLVSSVLAGLLAGEPVATTSGEQVRDFLCAVDLADAFVALLLSDVEGPVNMASGSPVRVRDLVEMLAAATGRADLLQVGERPTAPGEPAELTASVERLRDEVGWAPTASLEARVAETVEWWRQARRSGAPAR
jgi:nucleoside-diphosphate-sugar epimerase